MRRRQSISYSQFLMVCLYSEFPLQKTEKLKDVLCSTQHCIASRCAGGIWTESVNFGSQTVRFEDQSFIVLECLADQGTNKRSKRF